MARKTEITGSEDSMALLLSCMNGLRSEVRKISRQMLRDSKPVFTNQEMMEIFGIASSTLKMWRDAGKLGFSQIGKIYLYSREDVDRFLKAYHFDRFEDEPGFRNFVREVSR